MIVHHDMVIQRTIEIVSSLLFKGIRAFIFQNVFGGIAIYLKNIDNIDMDSISNLIDKVSKELKAVIGPWFEICDFYRENPIIEDRIINYERTMAPVKDNVWLIEKYLSNLYWDENNRISYTRKTKNVVSFYSFKGGVGRTTTMVMVAINLAKKGNKVLLVDFDLEAPGVAGLFPSEDLPKYGVLDFLTDYSAYSDSDQRLAIDEYVAPVGDLCQVAHGGEIHILPAYGTVIRDNPDVYRRALMRFDLDIPAYSPKGETPIDVMLDLAKEFVKPDYILIDTRSGIHQIGGIALSRYSDLSLLFFYGSQQNTDGMQMIIPFARKMGVPFVLINSRVPSNENLASIERNIFLEGSYNAMCMGDDDYQQVDIEDTTAEHYPLQISHNDAAEVIQSVDQLMRAYDEKKDEYAKIAETISDYLSQNVTVNNTPNSVQEEIIKTFSELIGGLDTAAAEDEFRTTTDLQNKFYPLSEFSFIFDSRKFLILGQKGTGKTALFNALKDKEYANSLADYLGVDAHEYEKIEWVVGTSNHSAYVSIARVLKDPVEIRTFLCSEIIRILSNDDNSLKIIIPSEIKDVYDDSLDISDRFSTHNGYRLEKALRIIDAECEKRGKYITVIYDGLDRIIPPEQRGVILSSLVSIWYDNLNTLKHIRSKIFLRNDIFSRDIDVPDKVKLKNYSSYIRWDYDQLFSMIWKRAISNSEAVQEWFFKIVGGSYGAQRTSSLGYVPKLGEDENKLLLANLVGRKMGGGNKAFTYKWFQNRLSDTQGVIVPRSMIDIFSKAAALELDLRSKKGDSMQRSIIRPRCFEDALPEVSDKRVFDLKEEFSEYKEFFENLKTSVERSPVSEDQLKKAIAHVGLSPEVIERLITLGVIKKYQRRQSDPVRYHFPDIYLHGLGLQRRGIR